MISDPNSILSQCDFRDDMTVADLGAGSGAYTFALAPRVPKGKIYAIEVQKDFLTTIKALAEKQKLANIEVLWATIEKVGGTKIADGVIDRAIVSNVLFQLEDRDLFAREVSRILKPGGQVIVVDWSDAYTGLGPKDLFSKEQATKLFTEQGFTLLKTLDAGAHHYGVVFQK